jgi:hypothetical protein
MKRGRRKPVRVGIFIKANIMSFFNRKKITEKRSSLESFKASAEAASVKDSIHKITGGTMSGCHPNTLM